MTFRYQSDRWRGIVGMPTLIKKSDSPPLQCQVGFFVIPPIPPFNSSGGCAREPNTDHVTQSFHLMQDCQTPSVSGRQVRDHGLL